MSLTTKNMVLILIVLALAVFPLAVNKHADFGGADGKAEELIGELNPVTSHGLNPSGNLPAGKLKACSLPCRQLWVRGSLAIT